MVRSECRRTEKNDNLIRRHDHTLLSKTTALCMEPLHGLRASAILKCSVFSGWAHSVYVIYDLLFFLRGNFY